MFASAPTSLSRIEARKVSKSTMFKFLKPAEASKILPGTLMFLPPRVLIPQSASTEPKLLDGAFNHPVVILSCPVPAQHNSRVEFTVASMKYPLKYSSDIDR